ncbi:hypothetical protein KNU02_gp16 [Gordonia phage Pleakley]|uniref:Uncharacterized protein n=1 Tax=Gordonia phage Pleakley TaxID=2283246 RepID=A0A345M6D4_9CAUD|nr:hypothetical protein KNU02_gp16 [Gordonia phage Pleakley]AXH49742.1 hypothetical protein SEA_FURY_16 [Gordonia phage Fury]AXH66055.1 hypothetical protein SEA_PLEAKLEY_16 [Gordonia phage Pleakley]
MSAAKIEKTRTLTVGDGTQRELSTALMEFLENGAYTGPISVSVSRVEHDRYPGSYDSSVTFSITE